MKRTWLIMGVSSGFGYEITKLLLESGNTVIGTVRNTEKVKTFIDNYPHAFDCRILDVTDVDGVHALVKTVFDKYGKIDVVVSNAGYGLFGAAEEFNDVEINKIIATNLTGSIMLIHDSIPYMRKQGYGRIIQISSYGGQVAFPGNSMYHATKWGIEGFCESVSKEVADFGIGITIVEPGGARTEFRYGSAKVTSLTKVYDGTPTHAFLKMLDKNNRLAPGNPTEMAKRIIESVEVNPAPLRMVLGAAALKNTIEALNQRISAFEKQTELASSTDYKEGE